MVTKESHNVVNYILNCSPFCDCDICGVTSTGYAIRIAVTRDYRNLCLSCYFQKPSGKCQPQISENCRIPRFMEISPTRKCPLHPITFLKDISINFGNLLIKSMFTNNSSVNQATIFSPKIKF